MNFTKKQTSSFKSKFGFGLIETLVGTSIFIVIAISTYQVFGILMDAVALSRTKILSTSLANEQFEIIRNLPYSDVGIVSGVPAGKIERNQTIVRDNNSFNIQTTIRNVDDPYDGTIGGSPGDLSPADYKSIDLDVTCANCKLFPTLSFTTTVSPRSLETASTNGALFVRVFNSSGMPVQGATIHIENTQTNPDTIIDETTDNDGWLKIIDTIPGTEAYNIIATKAGYSTDKTYPITGEAGPTPVKLDATVVIKQVTQLSLSIDKLSSFLVSSINPSCDAVQGIDFSLTGTKLIGTPSVLKYIKHDFTTDTLGLLSIPDLEWDSYLVSLNGSSYDIAGTIPMNLVSLNPEESKSLKIIVVPRLANSLLISVKDSAGNPIDDATVLLEKTGFSQTKTTTNTGCSPSGQAFWNGLDSDNYDLTITKSGYLTSTTQVSVTGSPSWQNIIITMTPE